MIELPDGFHLVHQGQTYRLIGTRPYERKDGGTTTLIDWETECPECRASFRVSTTAKWEPTRRCEGCRAPGKRVAQKRIA